MPPEPGAAVAPGMPGAAQRPHDGRRSRWARWKPWLLGAFLLLVAGLLVRLSRSVDWALAWQSIRAYQPGTLAIAAALALASYAVYCTYDLLGRRQTGHGLPVARVVGVGFVSYAFNLNLGALVGGVGMRYRLYAQLGLPAAVTTQVLALSMVTNWLGYLLVGGTVFVLSPLQLPPDWELDSGGLRLLGAGMLLAALAYVALCWRLRGREWELRGRRFKLPGVRFAVAQFALSSLNWLLISSIVFMLLRDKIDYASVLAVMLIAAVAGVISHIPAGLGVLEAVFLALLSHRAGQGELMAALLAYRALYYLVPLAIATVLFFATGMGKKADTPPDAAGARDG